MDDKNHFGFSLQGAKTGKDNGFSVLFDIESFDYGYYDEGSEGLKVILRLIFLSDPGIPGVRSMGPSLSN